MAHGVSEILGERNEVLSIKKQKRMQQQGVKKNVGVMGSRRIFSPAFKLKVLESYRNDMDCRGNQRATARKYGIHRRQIQKWLQCEENLRNCLADGNNVGIGKSVTRTSPKPPKDYVAAEKHHHQQQQQVQPQPPQQQQQQQQHQMHNGAGAPPPALNLCVARQHGDELLLQQQQDQQRPPPPSPQQSPPLPPPPSTSSSSNSNSSIVAAQALAAAAAAAAANQRQTDYRYHGNAVTVLPPQATAAQTGYPELQNKIVRMPPYTNAQMMDLYQARAITGFPDPALVPACYRRHSAAIAPQEINRYAELQYYQRSSSPRYHEIRSPMQQQQQEMSPVTLLSPAQIKIERASPDSRTTPGSVDAIPSAYSSATTATGTTTTTTDSIRARSLPSPHIDFIPKKEQLTETEYRHEKISAISPERLSNSNTPPVTPYYNMSCLPLSPGDSDEPCSTEASDIETDHQTTDTHVVQRKSYPVRFKLEVLNAFRYDDEVKGNQRATARKYNICRRQVQKWLLQEADLRNVFKTTGNGDRQRLGPFTEPVTEETPVDLRTSHPSIPMMLAATTTTTTELGQISPRSTNSAGPCSCCDYRIAAAASPLNYAIESSLTPPYSAPGCSLSCCPDVPAPGSVGSNYCCYSPPELDSHPVVPVHESSLKRSICTQSCCMTDEPASKRPHLDDKSDAEEGQEQPIQESPLCLVKPRHEESTSPSSKVTKDAILFKPYLDNPVSKPNNRSSPVISNGTSNNNNNNSTCNYNVASGNAGHMEQMSFKLPVTQQPQDQQQHLQQQHQQQQQPQPNAEQYLGYAEARSAFVRYPSNGHYS